MLALCAQTRSHWLTHAVFESSENGTIAIWAHVVEERNAPRDDDVPFVDTSSSDALPRAVSTFVAAPTSDDLAPPQDGKVRLPTKRYL